MPACCPACGASNPPDTAYCGACGAELATAAPTATVEDKVDRALASRELGRAMRRRARLGKRFAKHDMTDFPELGPVRVRVTGDNKQEAEFESMGGSITTVFQCWWCWHR